MAFYFHERHEGKLKIYDQWHSTFMKENWKFMTNGILLSRRKFVNLRPHSTFKNEIVNVRPISHTYVHISHGCNLLFSSDLVTCNNFSTPPILPLLFGVIRTNYSNLHMPVILPLTLHFVYFIRRTHPLKNCLTHLLKGPDRSPFFLVQTGRYPSPLIIQIIFVWFSCIVLQLTFASQMILLYNNTGNTVYAWL